MKSAGMVCKELGIRYYSLDYLIRNGYVPEPARLGSGQRIFTEIDIRNLKAVLADKPIKRRKD